MGARCPPEAGLTLDDVIETVAVAAAAAAERLGVVVTLTVVAMRSADPALNLDVARRSGCAIPMLE